MSDGLLVSELTLNGNRPEGIIREDSGRKNSLHRKLLDGRRGQTVKSEKEFQ
jgi:hypothetical protein